MDKSLGKPYYITEKGLKKLHDKLHKLKTIEMPKASLDLAEAASKGDFKENAEFHAAKEAMSLLKNKMEMIQSQIMQAHVLDASNVNTDRVSILTKVTVRNTEADLTLHFTLVGAQEVDPKARKISVDTPIGQGLIGKQVGDCVTIEIPAGQLKLEILKIEPI